jgi:hypothetical protein
MTAKSKLGRSADIFAPTKAPAERSARPAPAAPPAPVATSWPSVDNKLTVIIPPDLVAFLDRLCLDIRQKTGAKIRRTEIIRALVEGVRTAGVDLTRCGGEEEVAAEVAGRLRR